MNKKTFLHHNWRLKIIKSPDSKSVIPREIRNKWIPAAVPGTIHTDLFRGGIIRDPFQERNEFNLEWVSGNDCIYSTKFNYPEIENKKSLIKLVFEGIDTIADIYLNHRHLGRTENMFLKYEFNVSQILRPNGNILELHFKSPVRTSQETAKKYSKSTSLDSSRVYIRKAQYSFGWDWGPTYPTSGIWRSVYLLSEDKAAIIRINFDTEKISSQSADVKISFEVYLYTKKVLKALVSLSHNDKEFVQEMIVKDQSEYNLKFRITDPELWWPNGLGKQNLYELNIRLIDDKGKILDKKSRKVGIRKIDLQQRDRNKAIFRFKINSRPIYIRGMNWIPADSFLPRVSKNKYRKLLTLAKNANANMIRVWGGGIYEDDDFYDLCDELGLLVWQDFMFACANYPEDIHFINSVSREITQNVERLMNHPSIAVWCGNNENEWIWYRVYGKSYKEMPGYKIFHELIPELLKSTETSIPYRPTSPFGEEDDPNSQNSGNTHQWDIWSNWIDYTQVKNDHSLFVTEFGFQAPANIDTLKSVVPAAKRNIQSDVFEYYNKQIEGPEKVIRFLTAHLPLITKWEDFVYLAQLNQGLALKECIEHWRTNNKRTNGSIIWQLNDCWPVTSWSLIDSDIKPKISYFFVKNVFSKDIIYFLKTNNKLKIFLMNEGIKPSAVYERITIDARSGRYLNQYSKKILPGKKEYIEPDNLNISELPENKNWIILTTLYDSNNKILHRNFYKEKEWKHFEMCKAGVSIKKAQNADEDTMVISSAGPAFFVDVYYPGKTFSDRGFIMLPGENKQLTTTGGKGKAVKTKMIKIFCLNDYLQS